jgi:hypothetical protein
MAERAAHLKSQPPPVDQSWERTHRVLQPFRFRGMTRPDTDSIAGITSDRSSADVLAYRCVKAWYAADTSLQGLTG